MKKKVNWKILAMSFVIVFVFAGIGSYFNKIDYVWYDSVKPSITPPSYVFPIAWTILFIMIALSLYFALANAKSKSDKKEKRVVLILFIVNLALNALWSFLFFWSKNPTASFYELLILWVSILSLIIYTRKINVKSAYLLIPYLLWVSFAGILNYLIAF